MRAILCMLLLWQTCAPLCMPHLIGLPYLTLSLRWQTCASLCMPCPIGLPYFTSSLSDRHACPSACPVRLVCRISLRPSSDRHAYPSACPVRLVCRISLHCSADWRSCHLHVLAADLCLFSFSRDSDTAFAAAVMAPALVTAMIQTRHDTNWKLVVAEKVCPKDFAMMILWCAYF